MRTASRLSRFNVASLALGLAFLYLPIISLVVFSFNSSRQVVVWEHASLHWYEVLMKDAMLLGALKRSLWVAFLTTILAVVLGTPAALALARWGFRGKGVCITAGSSPRR